MDIMSETLRITGSDFESMPDNEFRKALAGYGIEQELVEAALAQEPGSRMRLVHEVLLERDPDFQEHVGPNQAPGPIPSPPPSV